MLLLLLALLTSGSARAGDLVAAEPAPVQPWIEQSHEFWLSRPYEAGVENRLLTDYFGRFTFPKVPWLVIEPGASVSFVNQWGLSLIGLNVGARIEALRSEIVVGAQEERWPDWQVTENRAILYWLFHASDRVSLSVGGGMRSPVFGPTGFWQTLGWQLSGIEVGPLYRLEWLMVSESRFGLTFLFDNYDRMRLYTWDNIHLSFIPEFQLTPKVKLMALLGTAMQGVSGGVISWDQYTLSLGVTYVP